MDFNLRLKVVGYFLTISEWDRHLEVIRQILNSIETFEPYAAYLRLTKGKGVPITATDISEFMKNNGFEGDYMAISLIVRLFDTRFDNSLDFEDFLKMMLSRDNPEIRFQAAQRDNYEVEQGDLLAPEIEYSMARFFYKASEFLSKIMSDPETHVILNEKNIFTSIDIGNKRILDFHNLKAFFEETKIRPKDTEIIAILRIIDINDDGKINETEFKFFIDLFSGMDPSQLTLNSLKKVHENENKLNYFGEKPNINPHKYEERRQRRQSSEKLSPLNSNTSKTSFRRKERAMGLGTSKDINTSQGLLNDSTTKLGTSFGPMKPDSYSRSQKREGASYVSENRSKEARSEFMDKTSNKSRTGGGRSYKGSSKHTKSSYRDGASYKRPGAGDFSRGGEHERSKYERSEQASVIFLIF